MNSINGIKFGCMLLKNTGCTVMKFATHIVKGSVCLLNFFFFILFIMKMFLYISF